MDIFSDINSFLTQGSIYKSVLSGNINNSKAAVYLHSKILEKTGLKVMASYSRGMASKYHCLTIYLEENILTTKYLEYMSVSLKTGNDKLLIQEAFYDTVKKYDILSYLILNKNTRFSVEIISFTKCVNYIAVTNSCKAANEVLKKKYPELKFTAYAWGNDILHNSAHIFLFTSQTYLDEAIKSGSLEDAKKTDFDIVKSYDKYNAITIDNYYPLIKTKDDYSLEVLQHMKRYDY